MPHRTVRRKLFSAIFGPTLVILVIIGVVSVWLDVYSVRHAIEREARLQSNVLALALRGPVSLGDTLATQETLDSLIGNKDIISGVVFSADGKVLARYHRERLQKDASNASGRGVFSVSQPIAMGQQQIGKIEIVVSLDRYYSRLQWFLIGAVGSLALLALCAAATAAVLGRRFSIPILRLSQTAKTISERRDYSVRVPNLVEVEFQNLSTAFNHMLGQIEEQNAALTLRNEELASANRELEAFTYTVSHDLRAPLRAISSFSHLVIETEGSALSEDGRASLARIEKNAIKMGQLIDDLLAFSKIDAQTLAFSDVNLTHLASEVWIESAPDRQKREIDFRLEELGSVKGDASLLRQVFANLLGNAIKYTRGRARAEIHVGKGEDEQRRTVYFVKDNGVGFDMQYAGKLFRVFQRLHKQKEFEGTGVGLAIVERIIARHGGRVWAEAQPDHGASFYFTLS